jgi:hypothetical protein
MKVALSTIETNKQMIVIVFIATGLLIFHQSSPPN